MAIPHGSISIKYSGANTSSSAYNETIHLDVTDIKFSGNKKIPKIIFPKTKQKWSEGYLIKLLDYLQVEEKWNISVVLQAGNTYNNAGTATARTAYQIAFLLRDAFIAGGTFVVRYYYDSTDNTKYLEEEANIETWSIEESPTDQSGSQVLSLEESQGIRYKIMLSLIIGDNFTT